MVDETKEPIKEEEPKITWQDLLLQYRSDFHRLKDIEEQLNQQQITDMKDYNQLATVNDLLFEAYQIKKRINITENLAEKETEFKKELKQIKEEVLKGVEGYEYLTVKEK